jgi:hypothetical protein
MKYKILPAMLLMLSATVAMAQNNDHKMTETQKADAAKADVFINNSEKKMTDSFNVTKKDSAAVIKKSKKRSCKSNKKSS